MTKERKEAKERKFPPALSFYSNYQNTDLINYRTALVNKYNYMLNKNKLKEQKEIIQNYIKPLEMEFYKRGIN